MLLWSEQSVRPNPLIWRGYSHGASGPQVERFREYLCLLAHAHLRPRHPSKIEASDIVQQTLLEAYEQRGQFRGQSDGELAAWLKQMLVHNLADALRGGRVCETRRETRTIARDGDRGLVLSC